MFIIYTNNNGKTENGFSNNISSFSPSGGLSAKWSWAIMLANS